MKHLVMPESKKCLKNIEAYTIYTHINLHGRASKSRTISVSKLMKICVDYNQLNIIDG